MDIGKTIAKAFILAAAATLAAPASPRAQTAGEITVFAAASLSSAVEQIAQAHTAATQVRIKLSFAASSTLARQIEQGAAAAIFISADEDWMDYLARRNLIDETTRRILVRNRLALVVPADKPLSLDIAADPAWLGRLPPGRIATGDPAHVPVGRYARQALTHLGVWPQVANRLAAADNVRNALVLVERGEAAAGIVYASDAAASSKVTLAAMFPEASHPPITYPIALLRGRASDTARAFHDRLLAPASKPVFAKLGFLVP